MTGNNGVIADGFNKLRLTCRTDSANPPSTITWYKNGQLVTSANIKRYETGEYGGQVTIQDLEILASPDIDGHVVECRASNGLKSEVTGKLTLDVRCKQAVNTYFL